MVDDQHKLPHLFFHARRVGSLTTTQHNVRRQDTPGHGSEALGQLRPREGHEAPGRGQLGILRGFAPAGPGADTALHAALAPQPSARRDRRTWRPERSRGSAARTMRAKATMLPLTCTCSANQVCPRDLCESGLARFNALAPLGRVQRLKWFTSEGSFRGRDSITAAAAAVCSSSLRASTAPISSWRPWYF